MATGGAGSAASVAPDADEDNGSPPASARAGARAARLAGSRRRRDSYVDTGAAAGGAEEGDDDGASVAGLTAAAGAGLTIPAEDVKKQGYRHWFYTYNNPPEDAYDTFRPGCYGGHQMERGASGTVHLQGFCSFKQVQRFSAMKKLNGAVHWEVMKGTIDQAKRYCSKAETRVEGKPFIEWGDKPVRRY